MPMLPVTVVCKVCKREIVIEMTNDQYRLWTMPYRALVQDIFPDKPPSIREILGSSTCGACYWRHELDRMIP